MSQNASHAVMAQRHEAPDSLDYFPTPPWATRALVEHLNTWGDVSRDSVWEPACGEGHMARPLAESFAQVVASDIHDYGHGAVYDFLGAGSLLEEAPPISDPDWIITNPPFNRAAEFALRAAEVAREGFALLVRTSFLEGGTRYEELFSQHPPEWILQFSERVIMTKGRLLDPGKLYWDEQAQRSKRPSSATSYCWIVWVQPTDSGVRMRPWHPSHFPAFCWIPPCRRRLERPGDYDAPELAA